MKFRNIHFLLQGTTSDQIAALAMKIKMAPLFAAPHLKQLLLLSQKKNRSDTQSAMEQLKAAFLDSILPDAKLHFFGDGVGKLEKHVQKLVFNEVRTAVLALGAEVTSPEQAKASLTPEAKTKILTGLAGNDTLKRLRLLLYAEDSFKLLYAGLASVMGAALKESSPSLLQLKKKCLSFLINMLAAKPEHEHFLLEQIVNKVGSYLDSDSSLTEQIHVSPTFPPSMHATQRKEEPLNGGQHIARN